jgi:hypothetical protein
VKPQTLLTLSAFVGALLVLAAYFDAAARHDEAAVRGAWLEVAPQACAALAVLGVAWARARPPHAAIALALANGAMTAQLTHLVLVFTAPLASGEPALARVWAALDVAGLFLVPFLALLLTQRPMTRPALLRSVQALAILAALVSARQLANAVRDPGALRIAGALVGIVAMIGAVRVAQRLTSRSARGGPSSRRA